MFYKIKGYDGYAFEAKTKTVQCRKWKPYSDVKPYKENGLYPLFVNGWEQLVPIEEIIELSKRAKRGSKAKEEEQ